MTQSGAGWTRFACSAAVVFTLYALRLSANSTTITFENFPGGGRIRDNTALSSEFPGVTFGAATVLTSQISLNELEFPPRSGVKPPSMPMDRQPSTSQSRYDRLPPTLHMQFQ